MKKEILEIHIDRKETYFIMNVAVRTGDAQFRVFFGKQDQVSNYGCERIVEEGKALQEDIACAMFPNLCQDYSYDNSTSQQEDVRHEQIDQVSELYEGMKDCLNSIITIHSSESHLIEKAHLYNAQLRDIACININK